MSTRATRTSGSHGITKLRGTQNAIKSLLHTYQPPPNAKPLDLRSAHQKVKWAKEHIGHLDSERVRFLGANRYFGVPKFNVEANCTDVILETLPTIPDEIPLILGDAAHNLRSALDHLACELVRSMNIEPQRVYFPICQGVKEYKAESDGQTKGMPQAAKDFIDTQCPYQGGNNGLWALHELDRIDKHRLLLTAAMKVGSWAVTLDQSFRNYNFALPTILKVGDIIGSVEGNHESDKQMSITAEIVFGEPDVLVGEPMVETLTKLADYVKAVVSYFGN